MLAYLKQLWDVGASAYVVIILAVKVNVQERYAAMIAFVIQRIGGIRIKLLKRIKLFLFKNQEKNILLQTLSSQKTTKGLTNISSYKTD